ncbi:hypothetical protein DKG74_08945 [Zavarzinia aquatilis]|uniref:DUF1302 domain-containing protein n=2 Tax=Zavarzinia aquatilis TaxID=2211142 RepID=A0A317EFQ5_9PROT|nr:hypothetical protein DKG74_08945 [Zavarzinia aquatilis]
MAAALLSNPAAAAEFQAGDVAITTQVTISAGFGIRTQDRDAQLICPQNYAGGSATTCNGDDGNLNFDKGDMVFAPVRAQGEATAQWQNFTFYVRGQAYYDAVYDNGDFSTQGGVAVPGYRDMSGRQSDAASNVSSFDYELMDLWVRGNFDIGDRQLSVKLGQQTIGWGEAAVTPLSLAQVNSSDQSKLRVPGAEIRDAVQAMPAIDISYELGAGLSVEAFYQFDFRKSVTDPQGSFFSTTDIGGKGGVGFGVKGDYDIIPPNATNFATGNVPLSVPQAKFESNSDGKNWGAAVRYYSPELNDTEFGFYFANIQPRSPVPVFYIAEDDKYINTAVEAGTALPGLIAKEVANYAATGKTPAEIAAYQTFLATNAKAQGGLIVQENARNSKIVLENPGEVQMVGASFNTNLDALGISLAGELALQHDLPVLIDGETWATDFSCGLYGAVLTGGVPLPCSHPAIGLKNQLSDYLGSTTNRPGARVAGYLLEDVYTYVLRSIKSFGSTDTLPSLIGANSASLLLEFGGVYMDLPDPGVLTMDAGGTGTIGDGSSTDPRASKLSGATEWSGGLTMALSASYPDAILGANLTPALRVQTGLFGITPLTGGYTREATAVTFALDADYLLQWKGSIGYTTYFGAGRQNLLNDRDFFQMTLSYSF